MPRGIQYLQSHKLVAKGTPLSLGARLLKTQPKKHSDPFEEKSVFFFHRLLESQRISTQAVHDAVASPPFASIKQKISATHICLEMPSNSSQIKKKEHKKTHQFNIYVNLFLNKQRNGRCFFMV